MHGAFVPRRVPVGGELYEEPPTAVIRTLIRWMLTDPESQSRFVRFLGRDIPPEGWMTPALMRPCATREAMRDVRGLWA